MDGICLVFFAFSEYRGTSLEVRCGGTSRALAGDHFRRSKLSQSHNNLRVYLFYTVDAFTGFIVVPKFPATVAFIGAAIYVDTIIDFIIIIKISTYSRSSRRSSSAGSASFHY